MNIQVEALFLRLKFYQMIKEYEGRVKVSTSIKPLLRKDRVAPKLKVGGIYFVSFGTNNAYPCFLKEIINTSSNTEVKVEILIKPRYRNQLLYPGYKVKILSRIHLLYANEIGITPEDAVRNCV